MDDDLEGIVLNIRACIVSSKGPIPIRNLSREYECIVGNPIPYRRLKYSTLEDFLKSIPSLRVCGSGSQAMVEAATSSASKHITALISKQKSTAKKFPQPLPYTSGRGGRGRGRGNYQLRSSAPREYTARDYNDRDQPTRDYTARKPTRDYFSREPTWDYSSRESTWEKNSKDYPSRDQSSVDYEAGGDPPKRYSPNLQNRQDTGQASGRPITVKVEDDKRQVSFSTSRKTELPPRLQRLRQINAEVHTAPLVSPSSQDFETNLFLDQSNSPSIISPLGPSQLIAAGRAKQQAEKEKLEQQYYQMSSSDFLLSPSENATNNLAMDFARLGHKDTFRGDSLGNHQTSFNGKTLQTKKEASVLQINVPLPKPDELNIVNNMRLLQQYCSSRGWPDPSYTVLHHKCPDTRIIVNFASVKVNGDGANTFKIGTLPFEHEDENIVKGYAAKIALVKIIEEESKVKADKTISSDSSIICNRISDIVARASTGLFAKSVEDEYVKRHNELLPSDWLQTVSKWPAVSVESTVNSTIIVPRKPNDQVQFDPTCAPPPLPIDALGDDEGIEDVYVTHATSASNIWFRVIGKEYSEKYEVLLEDMDRYYRGFGVQELALMLEEGHYYAAHKFDTWFRVCVMQVDEVNKTVLAWLIDLGGEDQFEFGSLYRLAPQFCQLPQQAVLCTLEGLEGFGEDEIANAIVASSKLLINQTLVAKISCKDTESGSVKATFYDTSGDDDINVNEQIKDEIIAESKPALPAEGCVKEVYIGHVSKKGEVFVMCAGPSLECMMETIESLGPEKISEHKLTSFKHISLNKLYMAKYNKDGDWYRAVVTTTPSMQHNKIPVHFVDYGNNETVTISDIADLEKLPPILKKLPPQALKVALHSPPLETLTNPDVARLHALLLDEEKVVLLKTVSLRAYPPTVEIFTKESDNTPVSVNSQIELQRKLYRTEDQMNLFNPTGPEGSVNQLINNLDEFDLPNPDLSDKDFLPVLITLAAHPGYFIFQPGKYNKYLNTLSKQMFAYYEAGALSEVPPERVMKNKLFAARYDGDECWYRVLVTDSPSGTKVPIRLCDYGDVSIVNISNLRELAPEFHIHPFSAIKGKLAGVKPAHKDWSVEDCIRFQNLVVRQRLAGIIKHVEINQDPMDMVVTLTLVDTRSDKDKYIGEILCSELRAVRDD